MKEYPKITIAIPTFKRLNFLKEACQSVLATGFTNLEILISLDVAIDSGQPDAEILHWLNEMVLTEVRLRYYVTDKNLGLSNHWNFILTKATGNYMMIIGDDDRLLPDCLNGLLRGIEAGADISFCNHYLIDADGKLLQESFSNTRKFNRDSLEEGLVKNIEKYIWLNAVPISAALIKTSLLQEIRFPPDMNTPEIVFFLKAAQAGASFYFSNQYLVEYRVHKQSATSQGLFLEKLFENLVDFPVSANNEIYKTQFMQYIIGGALHRYIQTNQRKKALQLFFHHYYPRRANYMLSFGKQLLSLITHKKKKF
ncbi:MAG: glycosyltransferase [Sphingobacteriales bacterium]|uniref:glycosyltransferase family 2 protein n=1 Tax=Hydrotalea flava TaxID=714549 RepID=UPI00082D1D98|nr:glycosyltransferase family 2 protein [Hydrotalea flava]RTL49083.1 MAG: glycosyltransferase [Sphingobacteriales bacterium]